MQFLGLFLVILVLLAIVAGVYLSVSARSAAIGRHIQEMQNSIRLHEQGNETLKSKLAELSSSRKLEERSNDIGFVPAQVEEAIYVLVPGYSGRPPITLAPQAEEAVIRAPVLPDEYTESLFDWIFRQISPYVLPIIEVQK
jgi:hypothetical protein